MQSRSVGSQCHSAIVDSASETMACRRDNTIVGGEAPSGGRMLSHGQAFRPTRGGNARSAHGDAPRRGPREPRSRMSTRLDDWGGGSDPGRVQGEIRRRPAGSPWHAVRLHLRGQDGPDRCLPVDRIRHRADHGRSHGIAELDDELLADLVGKIGDARCPECPIAVRVLPLHLPMAVEPVHAPGCPRAELERGR